MAGNDLKMNHLSYDVAGFDAEFKKILNLALNHLSARVADIFKREINANSDKIADAMKKVADARRSLAAIEEGDEEALRCFAAYASAYWPRIQAHGHRLVTSEGNSWSSPILGNGK